MTIASRADPQAIIQAYLDMEEGLVTSGRQTYSTALLNATGSGNTELVGADATRRIRLLWVIVTNNDTTTNTIHFQSATTRISANHRLLEGAGWAAVHIPHYYTQTEVNEALNINLSSATAVGIDFGYILV